MRNSAPSRARQSETNARSVEACFMPTSVGTRSAISTSVGNSTFTAARTGM